MAQRIQLLSLNVCGAREKNKRNRIIQYIQQQKSNVICLQETRYTEEIAIKSSYSKCRFRIL